MSSDPTQVYRVRCVSTKPRPPCDSSRTTIQNNIRALDVRQLLIDNITTPAPPPQVITLTADDVNRSNIVYMVQNLDNTSALGTAGNYVSFILPLDGVNDGALFRVSRDIGQNNAMPNTNVLVATTDTVNNRILNTFSIPIDGDISIDLPLNTNYTTTFKFQKQPNPQNIISGTPTITYPAWVITNV